MLKKLTQGTLAAALLLAALLVPAVAHANEADAPETTYVEIEGFNLEYDNAVVRGRSYLSTFPTFSRAGLISQLEFEGFTTSQAEHAVSVLDGETDWYYNAILSARSYLRTFPEFSRAALISQLEFERFTTSQAEYAVNRMDEETNWYDNAVASGRAYVDLFSPSRQGLIDYLVSSFVGFTPSQAEFAARVIFDGYEPAPAEPEYTPAEPEYTPAPDAPAEPEYTPTPDAPYVPAPEAPAEPEYVPYTPAPAAPATPPATGSKGGNDLPAAGANMLNPAFAGVALAGIGAAVATVKAKKK